LKKWTDHLNEEPSKDHTKQVRDAAATELAVNRSRSSRRFFTWNLVGGMGLLGIACAGFFRMILNSIQTYSEFTSHAHDQTATMVALSDISEPRDFDLVADLELIDDLESLEEWNGVDV
jgi:hypothetical protein